jgi:ribosomal protein L21E
VVSDGEGPWFDKVVTPRFTQDGKRIVYRARSDGQRFVVVADPAARTIREHPRYAGVFDVVFPPDGRSLGYGVAVGQELWWKVVRL